MSLGIIKVINFLAAVNETFQYTSYTSTSKKHTFEPLFKEKMTQSFDTLISIKLTAVKVALIGQSVYRRQSILLGIMAQLTKIRATLSIESWTCYRQVVGSNPGLEGPCRSISIHIFCFVSCLCLLEETQNRSPESNV